MSHCCTSPNPEIIPSPSSVASRLYRSVKTAILQSIAEIQRARRRSAGIRMLDAMSDRQLLDIGIDRSEIPGAIDRALDARKTPL
ncbi:DUF1127 domain-containing protein [Nisaea acidiphila]|uniref:DUF1127 domain-containing protein n=1 Tax=Nisaea acidiphila TaxID=1862145 RepID=A0A9J7ASD8_9PROT|nr:DUF1127 domain-containing protein [Nisaea acidiphila]UUX49457.1 DUF1127 domain-containing protein [Nisaea acidiphila]